MEFFSDKNEQIKHLRKGFIGLLDAVGVLMYWASVESLELIHAIA